jgi:hypothetical protein
VGGAALCGLCVGLLLALCRALTNGHDWLSDPVLFGLLTTACCVLVWPDRVWDCSRDDLDQPGIGFPAFQVKVRAEDNTVVVRLVGAQRPVQDGVLLQTAERWTVLSERFHVTDDAAATERVAELRVEAERLVAAGRAKFHARYQVSKESELPRDETRTLAGAVGWPLTTSQVRPVRTCPSGGEDTGTVIAQECAGLSERAVIEGRGPSAIAQRARASRGVVALATAAAVVWAPSGFLGAPLRTPVDAALLFVSFVSSLIFGFALIFFVFEVGVGYWHATHRYDRDELDRPGYGFPEYSVEVESDERDVVIGLVGRQRDASYGMLRDQDRWQVVRRRFPAHASEEATEYAALLRAHADRLTERGRDAFLERYSDFEAGATEREDARLLAAALGGTT